MIVETQPRGAAIVVTNLHVVDQGDRVTVRVNDSKTLSAVFLGYDALRDLAVLRVCCDASLQGSPLSVRRVSPGESVYAMGYPLGIDQASVTSGKVSRVTYDRMSERWMVQTDAPINPGNSGGPLFTLDGEVIGINTSVVRESSTGRAVEGFGFAVSARTVLQVLPSLKAGTIGPPPSPTATPTPTPRPINEFGPFDGTLKHNPADGLIKTEYADVSFRDLIVGATFTNPYSASAQKWDYGFILDGGPGTEDIHIVVTGDHRWAVLRGTEAPRDRIGGGAIKNFHTGTGQQNRISVVTVGQRGWVFVNGEFISALDLNANTGAWDVAVMTGAFIGNEVSGKSTRFEGFEGTRLTKQYGPASGDLKEDNGSGWHDSGVSTLDFVAEARFSSSQRAYWHYGFWFRSRIPDRNESISVVNHAYDAQWFHLARKFTSTDYVQVGSGFLSTVGAQTSTSNQVLLIVAAQSGWLFVNNKFVASLDLRHNLQSGLIFVSGSSLEGHQGTIQFEDFNVWAPYLESGGPASNPWVGVTPATPPPVLISGQLGQPP